MIAKQFLFVFWLLAASSAQAQVFVPTDSISNVSTFVGKPFESADKARVFCVAYDDNRQLQILTALGEREFTVFAPATITSEKNVNSTIYTMGSGGGACGWIDTLAISNTLTDWHIFPVKTNRCDTCELRITNVEMIDEEKVVFTAEEYFVRKRDTIDHIPVKWVTPISSVIAIAESGNIELLERDTINRDKRHTNVVRLGEGRLIVGHTVDAQGSILTLIDNGTVIKKVKKPTELETKTTPTYLHVAKSGLVYCFFDSDNVGPWKAKCSVVTFNPVTEMISVRSIDDIHSVRHVVDFGTGIACATSSGILILDESRSSLIPSFDPFLGLIVEVFGLHKDSQSRLIAYTPTGLMIIDSNDRQTSVEEEVLPDGLCTWSIHSLNGTMIDSGQDYVEFGNLVMSEAGLPCGVYLRVVRYADGRVFNKKLVLRN